MPWSPYSPPTRPLSTSTAPSVPFWTVATSADQLLGFFEENQNNATKITVDIDNVYNQLTGGLVINQDPARSPSLRTARASMAPNGKLPAASILDSKGIVLNKEDRVSVEKDGDDHYPARTARDAWRGNAHSP